MHQDIQVIRRPPKAPGRRETHGEASEGVRVRRDQTEMDGGVSFRRWWLRSWSDISHLNTDGLFGEHGNQ